MRPRSKFAVLLLILSLSIMLIRPGKVEAASFLGPSLYQCFDTSTPPTGCDGNDSPFKPSLVDFTGGYFHLEDFEDGFLNTPGVSADSGYQVGPGSFRDSVDEDDGTIDGSGTGGWAWYTASMSVTFTFNVGVLGTLPTHAGIVWTDVGDSSPTNYLDSVTFEAFDSLNASLGTIGPSDVGGDGSGKGNTLEDKFFGVIHSGGISKITMSSAGSSDWEVDHLQYGATVIPQPVVTNGTFEGDVIGNPPSGWNVFPGVTVADCSPPAGNKCVRLVVASDPFISQDIVVPSLPFFLDFDYELLNGTLDVTLGGALLTQLTTSTLGFVHFNGLFDPLALDLTGGSTETLAFTLSGVTDDQVSLDNIEVTPTPEPETLLLFGTGLAGLGFVRRRRKA